jgi:putative transposase
MPKKGRSEGQILRALRQAESGTRVSEICREYGIRDATFYSWKKKLAGLALSELRELRQLREENGKLKLVADPLAGSPRSCRRSCKKSCKAPPSARAGSYITIELPFRSRNRHDRRFFERCKRRSSLTFRKFVLMLAGLL